MKKFLISAFFVVTFGAYATYNYFVNTPNAQAVTAPVVPSTSSISSQTSPVATANTSAGSVPPTNVTSVLAKTTAPTSVTTAPVTTSTPSPNVPKGQYVDGTYTGSVNNAYYGDIQVEAIISGGKLTDVVFLQSPNDRSTSRFINQQAMPELKAEAIQAQSANVDGVSGASDSSAAFEQSLANALSQAQA